MSNKEDLTACVTQAIEKCGCSPHAFFAHMKEVGEGAASLDVDAEVRAYMRSRIRGAAPYTPRSCVVDFANMTIQQPCIQQFFKHSRKNARPPMSSASPA